MAVNIIQRHGLVPKEAFPETKSSSATAQMNARLKDILRTSAYELREILINDVSMEDARIYKNKRMKDIYRLLCIHLGGCSVNVYTIYYTILYSALLCYTMLYSATLCYTLLSYTIYYILHTTIYYILYRNTSRRISLAI